ncbi:unnamed protein product [Blepharisma stoltei]|uniref:Uncharacterized protein n=1 Tax=Blepharisma stoltei TaxID=1481888 RepID=A0AAU9JZU0_9CILI|nr:unnamed protein product [Blepharisma stoltei]
MNSTHTSDTTRKKNHKATNPLFTPDITTRNSASVSRKSKLKSDSSTLDNLNILESVLDSELELKFQSKQRTNELLKTQNGPISEEIQLQLHARDMKINELNREILSLRAKLKLNKENNIVQELQEKSKAFEVELLSQRFILEKEEKRYEDLKQQYDNSLVEWELERAKLIHQQEEIRGEVQVQKIRLGKKREENDELKNDNIQLSKLIDELTGHNKELVAKVENMINELDETARRYHELKAKEGYYDQVEKMLEEYMAGKAKKDTQKAKFEQAIEKMKKFKGAAERIENSIKDLEDSMKKKIVALNSVRPDRISSELPQITGSLQDLIRHAEEIRNTFHANIPTDLLSDSSPAQPNASTRVVELEQELLKIDLQFKQYKAEESTKDQQIESLKQIMERHHKEHLDWQAHMKSKILIYKQRIQDLKDKAEMANREVQKKDFDIQNDIFKLENLNNKIELLAKKNNEAVMREEDLKSQISSMKSKIASLIEDKHSSESNLKVRERKIYKSLMVLQTIKQEMFKKDTELLKKNKEIARMEGEMEKLKGMEQKFHSRAKLIEGDLLSKLSKELEERDQKIDMLKEMLRGNQPARRKTEESSEL